VPSAVEDFVGGVLEKWSEDRELELGIDALLVGFERPRAT
jgi:hypothetical protein